MTSIARTAELRRLLDAHERCLAGRPQLVVVYGRRQVGKTTLVRQLLDRIPTSTRALSFVATEEIDERSQLERLSAAAQDGGLTIRASNWRGALDQVTAHASDVPLVVAMDEVPYLEQSTPGWGTVLQAWWDEVGRSDRRLLVILTGSAVATMQQWLGSSGPLFQRANDFLPMQPFDLPQSHELLGRHDPSATIEAVAACGGFPGYLSLWDPEAPCGDNLERLAFSAFAPLNFAGRRQMADAPAGGGYHGVLRALSRGRTRHSEIATAVGQRVDSLLDVLERAGFIRRAVPIGQPGWSKQARYEFADPFVRFWFTFIYPDAQLIEAGQGRAVKHRLDDEWNKHLGWVFEEEARKHAVRLSTRGAWGDPLLIGRYWSHRTGDVEIDICGLRGKRIALVGEAKWSPAPVGLRQLDGLRSKASRVTDTASGPRLVYWSRGELTDDVRRSGDLTLFGPGDMVTP